MDAMISTHLTLEALAGTPPEGVAVAIGNGMIDLLHGSRAGCHATLAQLHQFGNWLNLYRGDMNKGQYPIYKHS